MVKSVNARNGSSFFKMNIAPVKISVLCSGVSKNNINRHFEVILSVAVVAVFFPRPGNSASTDMCFTRLKYYMVF